MQRFTDRTVAVTGGGGGIGGATCRRFGAEGAKVAVLDMNLEAAEKVAAEIRAAGGTAEAFRCDITNRAEVDATVAGIESKLGPVDVLVNNAGWSKIEPVAEMSLDTWKKCLDIDLTGTFSCMRFAMPHMINAQSGNIVNISSISGWEMTKEHGAAYSAAKAGVMALTRVAAAENGKHGIRVNAIAPGLIYNDFLRRIYPDEFFDTYLEKKAFVNRLGQPEDVANLVSFLVSDKAGYITGETYGISGGVHPHA